MAQEQLDIFELVGVKPQRVVIGHLGYPTDPTAKLQKEICRRGAFVGIDRLGSSPEADAKLVPVVKALIDAGYASHVLFASDFNTDVRTLPHLKKSGGPGYARALNIVPMLKAEGVSDDVLHGITVDNPRRFLAFVPKKGTS
jgi:phosphotriesterase-related protein